MSSGRPGHYILVTFRFPFFWTGDIPLLLPRNTALNWPDGYGISVWLLLPFSMTLACTTQPLTSFGVRLPSLPLVEWVLKSCRSFASLKDHATGLADQSKV